jgi:predicted house-cleaning noncanonical NTP pyrophosphatase (MazG superfamily)
LVIKYNKAIRDKIPEIIESTGKDFKVVKLSNDEFLPELEKKLREELQEYEESKSIVELADMLEVIFGIAKLKGVDEKELNDIRLTKLNERGKFSENLFLIETSD